MAVVKTFGLNFFVEVSVPNNLGFFGSNIRFEPGIAGLALDSVAAIRAAFSNSDGDIYSGSSQFGRCLGVPAFLKQKNFVILMNSTYGILMGVPGQLANVLPLFSSFTVESTQPNEFRSK